MTAVAAAVKAAEAAGAVEMAAAVEAAVKTAEAAASSVEQKQMKELQIMHKGRSERAVALEKATAAMTLAQLKKELRVSWDVQLWSRARSETAVGVGVGRQMSVRQHWFTFSCSSCCHCSNECDAKTIAATVGIGAFIGLSKQRLQR